MLTTIFTVPHLYLRTPSGNAVLLHTFIEVVLGLFGIAETGHGLFYVAGGNFSISSAPAMGTSGTWGMWEVNLRSCDDHEVVRVRRVVSLPDAVLPNVAKALSFLGSALLVADSVVGRGWEIHVDIWGI